MAGGGSGGAAGGGGGSGFSGYGGTRSPGGTGYGGDRGAQGTAGEMSGGAGGAGMAGYGGGGMAGVADSGWGGSGGSAGRQAPGGSFATGDDGRLHYVGAQATQKSSSSYNNPAAARIGGYSTQQFHTAIPAAVNPVMKVPPGIGVNLNPTANPYGGTPGSIGIPSSGKGLPSPRGMAGHPAGSLARAQAGIAARSAAASQANSGIGRGDQMGGMTGTGGRSGNSGSQAAGGRGK